MSDKIYLIDTDGDLHPMPETKFDNEDMFQALLEQHPDLLITGGETSRWLLVTREMPVADTESGVNRWSLDHLFLDQNGIPTLVEVKRSTDTRRRREVVGQMLDYAANAVTHWSVDKIIAELEKRCVSDKTTVDDEVRKHLQLPDDDEGEAVKKFWDAVGTNLDAEKLRLLFVADKIPSELQRIIEFLNNQMAPAVVLGIELKLFKTDQFKTLVPRVVGQTEKAKHKKGSVSSGLRKQWDEALFLDELGSTMGSEARVAANDFFIWWKNIFGHLEFGKGANTGSVHLRKTYLGQKVYTLSFCTNGRGDIGIGTFPKDPLTQSILSKYVERVKEIGIDMPSVGEFEFQDYKFKFFHESSRRKQMKDAIEWLFTQLENDKNSD